MVLSSGRKSCVFSCVRRVYVLPFCHCKSLEVCFPLLFRLPCLLASTPCACFCQERSLTAIDFTLFAACGAVGCTTTHLTVIPLDVVKTRLQTDPGRYTGLTEGVTTIAKEVRAGCCRHPWQASLHPASLGRINSTPFILYYFVFCRSLLFMEGREFMARLFLFSSTYTLVWSHSSSAC